jgi:hypothetical protein
VHGQQAWIRRNFHSLFAPRRQITLQEPGYGAGERTEATLVILARLLVMPLREINVQKLLDFEETQIALFADAGILARLDIGPRFWTVPTVSHKRTFLIPLR